MNTGEWSPFCTIPDGLTWPAAVGSQDGPTRGQAAGGRWRRSSRGLYVPAAVSDTVVEQRIVEQAARLPAGGAVTGWAALGLAGANYFDGLGEGGRSRLPVPLALGVEGTLKPAAGAVISREPLDAAEVRVLHDIPCTVPVRALFDEMRRGNARAAAVAMDMAAAARLVAIWQMTDYLAEHRSWRRARVIAGALPLADERSRSPAESRMRLIWVLDAGLPPPLCNRPVFDLHGRHLGTPDLLDTEAGVVGEYDGAIHLKVQRRARDTARQGRFRNAGLEYFDVVAPDMHDSTLVVERMVSTRNRALASDCPRRWTTTAPDDWEPDLSFGEELLWRRSLHDL